MDDKTKVKLCQEIINDFYITDSGEDCGYQTILSAVVAVLNFVGEETEDGERSNKI